MGIKATSQISIVDLNDAKSLSGYLISNLPKIQIYDPNTLTYEANWENTNLKVEPLLFINQRTIDVSTTTIVWTKKEGANAPVALGTGESSNADGVLTVTQNKLSSVSSGLITYMCTVDYIDPDTSLPSNIVLDITFSLIKTAMDSRTMHIAGSNIFKYAAGATTPTPTSTTLTAYARNTTVAEWQYWNGTTFVKYPGSSTSTTLSILPTHATFIDDVARIRVVGVDPNAIDTFSVYKVKDGVAGAPGGSGTDGITIIVSNEAISIPTDWQGINRTSSKIFQVSITAYQGTTAVMPNLSEIEPESLPSGMTITKSDDPVGKAINLHVQVAVSANLGNVDTGLIDLDIIVGIPGKVYRKGISWSKSKGGTQGTNGVNSILFQILATQGEVFMNQEGTLELEGIGYDGPTIISSGATYQWFKYSAGSWGTPIANTKNLIVNGADVPGIASYKGVMTYKTKAYSDIITLEDKTDSMLASILSTGGDVFKNTIGTSELICKVFQNGSEVDPLKSTFIQVSPPSPATSGDFWYKIDKPNKTVTLMKYSGSSWVAAIGVDLHRYRYNWSIRNRDGDLVSTTGTEARWKSKVIYVDGADVDVKSTFVCDVE